VHDLKDSKIKQAPPLWIAQKAYCQEEQDVHGGSDIFVIWKRVYDEHRNKEKGDWYGKPPFFQLLVGQIAEIINNQKGIHDCGKQMYGYANPHYSISSR